MVYMAVARNFMKMPANRISGISAEAQQSLQDCMCAQRSFKENLDVWLITAKQWLWSACANAQADLSHCLAECGIIGNAVARPIWCHKTKFEMKIKLNCQIYV